VSGSLGDRLRAVEVPGEAAAFSRGRSVVAAAFAERAPGADGRAHRFGRAAGRALRFRPAARWAAGALAVAGFAVLTPPGQAVIDSVRDSLGRVEVREAARPAVSRLPAAGSLLVLSADGPWVVRRDGSKRLLGPYREATWSPFGRFVGVTRENALLAVEPGGRVHWSLARPRVARPRWAPSGFRVAYLSGRNVRVVAGDGTGDRLIGRGVAAEWRPLSGGVTAVAGQKVLAGANLLAVARADGRVELVDVDSRQALWSVRAVTGPVRALSWSADGRFLLAATTHGVSVLDGLGRVTRRIPQRGAHLTDAVFGPAGERFAIVRRRGGVGEVVLVDGGRRRLRFTGSGRLGPVNWSPDGEWLLVPWPSADQFLFLPASGGQPLRAAPGVAREFDPRSAVPRGAPRPAGWCCATP
jgi:hypothetical protein